MSMTTFSNLPADVIGVIVRHLDHPIRRAFLMSTSKHLHSLTTIVNQSLIPPNAGQTNTKSTQFYQHFCVRCTEWVKEPQRGLLCMRCARRVDSDILVLMQSEFDPSKEVMPFGKYASCTLSALARSDPGYMMWILRNVDKDSGTGMRLGELAYAYFRAIVRARVLIRIDDDRTWRAQPMTITWLQHHAIGAGGIVHNFGDNVAARGQKRVTMRLHWQSRKRGRMMCCGM